MDGASWRGPYATKGSLVAREFIEDLAGERLYLAHRARRVVKNAAEHSRFHKARELRTIHVRQSLKGFGGFDEREYRLTIGLPKTCVR